MTEVHLEGICKSFGDVSVLKSVDLSIKSGEFVVFVGPSGCGKTTLLRLIGGLDEITSGRLIIGDRVVNHVPPTKRGLAMVFQSYALYPHMNVFKNMAFGMQMAKVPKPEIDLRVREAAEMLQITPLLNRLPKQLSGGQRQRVAIGRAIVRDPKVFLFDEPLSNLDASLRVETRIEIAKLHSSMPNTTMIYVTHDQVEAMTLANRIVVLQGGVVEQVGTPLELYQTPATLFVARFIGSPAMNTVECTVSAAAPHTSVTLASGQSVTINADINPGKASAPAIFGVRPEKLKLCEESGAIFSGVVQIVEYLGEVTQIYVEVGAKEPILAKLDGHVPMHRGDHVHLTASSEAFYLFDQDGKALQKSVEI